MQTFFDTIRYRHILFALDGRELKAQYRNMSLGFLWALLNSLVLVWHSQASIRHLSPRVIWIERGRLRMDRPCDEVLSEYARSAAASKESKRPTG